MVEIALILVVSELSYRFIEHPLTRLSYKDVWTQFTEFLRKPWDLREKGTMAFMTVISVIAVFGLIVAPANAKSAQQEQLEKILRKISKKLKNVKKKSKKVARKIVARPQKVVQNRVKAKMFYPHNSHQSK